MLGSCVLRTKDRGFFSPSCVRRMLIRSIAESISTSVKMGLGNGCLRMTRDWFGNYILWGCETK